MTDGRISGTAVAAATAGGLLIYAGLRDVSPLTALRDVLSRRPPGITSTAGSKTAWLTGSAAATGTAVAGAVAAATGLGGRIVADARRYLGVPYRWGGADLSGFDCSGLVTYVLAHDLGLSVPDATHTVTGQWLMWRGATTVPAAQRQPGDLVCWVGHIAIYSGADQMIEAPGRGKLVREVKLRSAGAVFRRPTGSG